MNYIRQGFRDYCTLSNIKCVHALEKVAIEWTPELSRALKGGVLGAGVGALGGALYSGGKLKETAIGGLLGGAGGAGIGYAWPSEGAPSVEEPIKEAPPIEKAPLGYGLRADLSAKEVAELEKNMASMTGAEAYKHYMGTEGPVYKEVVDKAFAYEKEMAEAPIKKEIAELEKQISNQQEQLSNIIAEGDLPEIRKRIKIWGHKEEPYETRGTNVAKHIIERQDQLEKERAKLQSSNLVSTKHLPESVLKAPSIKQNKALRTMSDFLQRGHF